MNIRKFNEMLTNDVISFGQPGHAIIIPKMTKQAMLTVNSIF